MSEINQSLPQVDSITRLEAAASQIQRWLLRVKMVDFFRRYTPRFVVVAFPAVIAIRFWLGFSRVEALLLCVGLILIWAVIGVIVSLCHRPDHLKSLSIWDRLNSKKDLLSSALAFENQRIEENRDLAEGEKLHISRTITTIAEVPRRLPDVIQMPQLNRAFAALGILAVAAITILPQMTIDEGEQLLTDEMQAEAEKQSDRLKELAADLKKMDEKSVIDRAALEKLRSDVDKAAEGLADTDGQTANEMLKGLEARARAAEKLAEKLGAADNQWASEEMIREMSQHADFADLAVTIKDKNADSASTQADKIAISLAVDDLKIETRDRITTALERTMGAAIEADKTKAVGERVGNASRKMQDQQAKTAAREFEELAKYFRTIKKRETARKKLEELASKLRDAGSKISGSKLEKMKQLAGGKKSAKGQTNGKEQNKAPKGLQSIAQATMPMPSQPMPQLPQSPQAGPNSAPQTPPSGPQALPVPGMAQKGPQSQKSKGKQAKTGMAAPVPGQQKGKNGKGQKGMAMNPNGKNGQNGKGQGAQQGLMAPVPGSAPSGKSPGARLGQSGGQSPSGNGQSSQPGNGGLEAGQGTAAMGNEASQALKAAKDATVVAQINKNGDSQTRAIEGQARTETAKRQSQAVIMNAIKVEEQALDEKSLPMSRRNHVQRYFTEIRRQFEKAE